MIHIWCCRKTLLIGEGSSMFIGLFHTFTVWNTLFEQWNYFVNLNSLQKWSHCASTYVRQSRRFTGRFTSDQCYIIWDDTIASSFKCNSWVLNITASIFEFSIKKLEAWIDYIYYTRNYETFVYAAGSSRSIFCLCDWAIWTSRFHCTSPLWL